MERLKSNLTTSHLHVFELARLFACEITPQHLISWEAEWYFHHLPQMRPCRRWYFYLHSRLCCPLFASSFPSSSLPSFPSFFHPLACVPCHCHLGREGGSTLPPPKQTLLPHNFQCSSRYQFRLFGPPAPFWRQHFGLFQLFFFNFDSI